MLWFWASMDPRGRKKHCVCVDDQGLLSSWSRTSGLSGPTTPTPNNQPCPRPLRLCYLSTLCRMARTHKGPLAPSQPASRRSSMDSNGGPSTPRATTGGKTMALIPPPRPTGIPKEGRYGVVISDSMRNMLESGSSSKRKHEDEEVVGLKCESGPIDELELNR